MICRLFGTTVTPVALGHSQRSIIMLAPNLPTPVHSLFSRVLYPDSLHLSSCFRSPSFLFSVVYPSSALSSPSVYLLYYYVILFSWHARTIAVVSLWSFWSLEGCTTLVHNAVLSSFKPASVIYLLHASFHLRSGRPLLLFPGMSTSSILLTMCSSASLPVSPCCTHSL